MWIKIQHSLLTDPKVKKIKRASGLSIQEVLGILCCFWIWVDQHVDSSAATQIDDVGLLIEDFGGNEQFWEAVQGEGWLEFRDGEFYVGGWEKQFSKSAKQRAQTAARVASLRQRQKDDEEPCNAAPLHERYQSRGEESKEEKREENTPSSPPRGTSPNTSDPKKRSKKTVAYTSDFEAWYNAYPKRTAKKAALSAYGKALDSIQQEKGYTRKEATTFLLESAQAFAKSPDGRGQYVPHPSKWLNQGRYDDDRATWQSDSSVPKEFKNRMPNEEEIEALNRRYVTQQAPA